MHIVSSISDEHRRERVKSYFRKGGYAWRSSTLAGVIDREQFVYDGMHVEADDCGNVEKFDDIDAATTTLDLRDDGLVAAQLRRETCLAYSGAVALLDNQVDESDVPG